MPAGSGTYLGKIHLGSNLNQFFLLISCHVEMAISQTVPLTSFMILTLFPPFPLHSVAPGAIAIQLLFPSVGKRDFARCRSAENCRFLSEGMKSASSFLLMISKFWVSDPSTSKGLFLSSLRRDAACLLLGEITSIP